jgi:hypothetical protein
MNNWPFFHRVNPAAFNRRPLRPSSAPSKQFLQSGRLRKGAHHHVRDQSAQARRLVSML